MELQARKPYATDLTDEQWALLEPHIPAGKRAVVREWWTCEK